MVRDALRNNDQAAYINGALQLARGELSPWHAALFNYDKQFGTYWLLAVLFRILHFRSVLLVTNLAQAIVLCAAFGALILYKLRHVPIFLILPFSLCPVLVLSAPFMGTGLLSLSFLLLGFSLLRWGHPVQQASAYLLIAIAAACRADVVLAVPTLILTELGRRSVRGLTTSSIALIIAMSSILPPALGMLWTANPSGIFQSPVFAGVHVVAGFVIFGLGAIVLLLLGWSSFFFILIAHRKRTWFLYYIVRALSPVIPFTFYVDQLQTPRHFLLTLACYVFTISDRRTPVIFWWLKPQTDRKRLLSGSILLLVIMPWLIGIKIASLANIRPTIGLADVFPTSHGHFPLGAYAFYMFYYREHGYVLDHNERIFLAAERAWYEKCNGNVLVLRTPMYNYLELVLRLNHLSPRIVDRSEVGCGYLYADARSLTRHEIDNSQQLLRYAETVASYDGQAILKLGSSETELGLVLEALHNRFLGREFEFEVEMVNSRFGLRDKNGGVLYALSRGECSVIPDRFGSAEAVELNGKRLYFWPLPAESADVVELNCPMGGQAGQAALIFPQWMGR